MTTFSLTTGYAVEALACLARHGPESMLVREIAERILRRRIEEREHATVPAPTF